MKNLRVTPMRSPEMLTKYQARVDNADLKRTMRDFPLVADYEFWIVVENEFPYDLIASVHHLIVPKRDFVSEWEMSLQERAELLDIKDAFGIGHDYDILIENFPHARSIPALYHVHVLKYKEQ